MLAAWRGEGDQIRGGELGNDRIIIPHADMPVVADHHVPLDP